MHVYILILCVSTAKLLESMHTRICGYQLGIHTHDA